MRSYEPFLNSDLSNVYFSSDSAGSSVIDSWLESGNSSSSSATTWWIVTSVGANSNTTIYMQVDLSGANHHNNTTTGVAPQLTPTYAEYDNGINIFSFYDNFAGTSLSSKWISSGGTVTVNNGITITGASPYVSTNTYTVSSPIEIEYYGTLNSIGINAWNAGGAGKAGGTNQGAIGFTIVSGGYYTSGQSSPTAGTNSGTDYGMSVTGVWEIEAYSSSAANFYFNYGNKSTVTSNPPTYPIYLALAAYWGTTSNSNVYYWARTRIYPPNGIMPSVSLGSPTNFPYYNTTTDSTEVLNY